MLGANLICFQVCQFPLFFTLITSLSLVSPHSDILVLAALYVDMRPRVRVRVYLARDRRGRPRHGGHALPRWR